MGWHFNTEYGKSFAEDTNGEIPLGSDILRADATLEANSKDLVQRGLRMYDRKNHTFTISTDVKLDIVAKLTFEDLT